ncbi:MAG: hypothetical protein RIR00_2327 [Pseudomonadota bacterium]
MFPRLNLLRCCFALLLLGALAPLHATEAGHCLQLDDPGERLACYDQAHGRQPSTAVEAAPEGVHLPGHSSFHPYKTMYALPVWHRSAPNLQPSSPAAGHTVSTPLVEDRTESKFQLSFQSELAQDLFKLDSSLRFAYTQTSRWQVYAAGQSRPFRENNYEPELLAVFATRPYSWGGWQSRSLTLALNHQSNGRADPYSRSWNRAILDWELVSKPDAAGHWQLNLRPWWRIPENSLNDDNPDISRYLGRGEAILTRQAGRHRLSLLLRHGFRSNDRGGAQFDWAFPLPKLPWCRDGEGFLCKHPDTLRGHLQIFTGYGESLIDYNHKANYLGLGVSLAEW